MKLSLLFSALLVSRACAFTASLRPSSPKSTLALHLFGGGSKDAEKKGPGMMDQLAMFKKAQEMATKKKKMDEELQKINFEGLSANGKVKGTFKFMPILNPLDPAPDYDAVSFEFDDTFFEASTPAEIAAATKSAIENGLENINTAVAEKYATLQADLMATFGAAPKQE